jgi:hypothetical protein
MITRRWFALAACAFPCWCGRSAARPQRSRSRSSPASQCLPTWCVRSGRSRVGREPGRAERRSTLVSIATACECELLKALFPLGIARRVGRAQVFLGIA